MAKLDAEAIAEAVRTLEATARAGMVRDLRAEVRDLRKQGRRTDEADTWLAGVDAVLEWLRENYA